MEIIQLKDNKRFIPCNYHINDDVMIPSYLDMETGALIPQNLKDDYTFWHNELDEKNEYVTFENNEIPFGSTGYCHENENLGSVAKFIDGKITYEKMKYMKVTPDGILDGPSVESRYVPCVSGVLFDRIINDVLNYNGWGEVTNSYMEVSNHMPNGGEFDIKLHDECDLKDVTWMTIQQIIQELRDLYNDYDVNSEAMLYVDSSTGRTQEGIPLTDVLEDCNEYKNELKSLEKECHTRMRKIQTDIQDGKYMDDFKTIYQASVKEVIDQAKKDSPMFCLTDIGKYKIDKFLQEYQDKKSLLEDAEKSPYEGYVTKDRILYDLNQQSSSNSTFEARYPISEKGYFEKELKLDLGSDFYSMNNPIQEMACRALNVYVQTITKDEHINIDINDAETYLKSLKIRIGLLDTLKQNLDRFYDDTDIAWHEVFQKNEAYIESGEFIERFNFLNDNGQYGELHNASSETRVKNAIRRELDKIYQNYNQELCLLDSEKEVEKQVQSVCVDKEPINLHTSQMWTTSLSKQANSLCDRLMECFEDMDPYEAMDCKDIDIDIQKNAVYEALVTMDADDIISDLEDYKSACDGVDLEQYDKIQKLLDDVLQFEKDVDSHYVQQFDSHNEGSIGAEYNMLEKEAVKEEQSEKKNVYVNVNPKNIRQVHHKKEMDDKEK